MLNFFESNVANGIGSMEIYNLKVKCTNSCNVFQFKIIHFHQCYRSTNLGSYYSSLDAISLLSLGLRSKSRPPLSLLDVVALGFTKAIPMTYVRPKMVCTKFL